MAKIYATSKLGDYLVAFRMATRKQVKAACKSMVATQMSGHAFVKADICGPELCEKVVAIEKRIKKTAPKLAAEGVNIVLDEKSFIGDILAALGFITPEEKKYWLAYQEDKRAKKEDPGRLGELLVDNHVCKPEERDLGMRVQDWLRGVNCAA